MTTTHDEVIKTYDDDSNKNHKDALREYAELVGTGVEQIPHYIRIMSLSRIVAENDEMKKMLQPQTTS